jgi:dTMP kinase
VRVDPPPRRPSIQQVPEQRPELRVLGPQEEVTFRTLLKNRNFLRLFLAQVVSSLGDWIGVIAIAVFAERIAGNAAVGLVMIMRVLPGFVAGPIAGVIADRWDRKKTMVIADLGRAGIIFSVPFVENLVYLLVASMVLECLTLAWGPAKDASLPHVVPPSHLTHANSLNLIAVYGPWPLASLAFASMATLGAFLGDTVPVLEGIQDKEESLALWVDSLTFCFSAAMIYTLAFPASKKRAGRLHLSEAKRDLVEGLRFVIDHKQVRPWLLGIGLTFAAAGGVFSLGVGFVEDVLGGGNRGFAFLIGFLGMGMFIGLLAVGQLAKRFQKDVLFTGSLFLLGAGLVTLASLSSLGIAIPVASALGFFGGAAYSMGYSLIHETVTDELRGRTFSAGYTVIRIGTLVGLGFFPLLASAIGDHTLNMPFGELDIPGTRSTLWFAGVVAAIGGLLSMRAIHHRVGVPRRSVGTGYFIVFEGGEGAGKSTQMAALVQWLKEKGEEVVTTKEPGGTAIGKRIRDIVLDPAQSNMSDRAEALLYAADRAQHVAEVIRPALEEGKVVVSDRFLDSSLAYQGIARGLGLDEVYRISDWAIAGLLPDLVVFLNVDASAGLERSGEVRDRIEQQGDDFHKRVGEAYLELARRWPDRFVVVDANRSESEVHQEIIRSLEHHADSIDHPALRSLLQGPGPPGPMPR